MHDGDHSWAQYIHVQTRIIHPLGRNHLPQKATGGAGWQRQTFVMKQPGNGGAIQDSTAPGHLHKETGTGCRSNIFFAWGLKHCTNRLLWCGSPTRPYAPAWAPLTTGPSSGFPGAESLLSGIPLFQDSCRSCRWISAAT